MQPVIAGTLLIICIRPSEARPGTECTEAVTQTPLHRALMGLKHSVVQVYSDPTTAPFSLEAD